jgi:hypothetical protein
MALIKSDLNKYYEVCSCQLLWKIGYLNKHDAMLAVRVVKIGY